MITPEQQAALSRPFPVEDIEWRLQSARECDGKVKGMALAYITAREVMNRLDLVFPGAWESRVQPFTVGKHEGFTCTLIAGGIERTDVSDLTHIEPVKGGASTALKRAAIQFGIGRYLYDLPNAYFKADVEGKEGKYHGEIQGTGKKFRWDPPDLPKWAIPDAVDVRVGDTFVAVPLDFVRMAREKSPAQAKDQYLKIIAKLPEGFNALPWSDRLDPMSKINRLIDLRARIVLWEQEHDRNIEL